MKFENIRVYNFENALRGMRNPKESWALSDSKFGFTSYENAIEIAKEMASLWTVDSPKNKEDMFHLLLKDGIIHEDNGAVEYAFLGPKDMKLALHLIKAGSEHRKFLRQLFVSVDITAPLYWWKEFDTYKVGTVSNSTSTMHKLTSKPITIDRFELDDFNNIEYPIEAQRSEVKSNADNDFIQMCLIPYLEYLRQEFLKLKDSDEEQARKIWKELVRWLPNGWLQTRTVSMNYENLYAICSPGQRRYHKLTEWSQSFMNFASNLPYASTLIFESENKE